MLGVSQRYRIFSFPWKSSWAIHSFKSLNLVFFFSREAEKKNTQCVFLFPSKSSYAIHSKLVSSPLFYKKVRCVFFSRFLSCFCVFFFSCKSSHVIHSFDFRSVFFFFRRRKKKTQHFHSFNRLYPKMCKKWTFTSKKKIRYLWVSRTNSTMVKNVWMRSTHISRLDETIFC